LLEKSEPFTNTETERTIMNHQQTNGTTLFADINLARRLEGLDAVGGVEYGRAHARLFPQSGATSIAVAGGYATYAGIESPTTQAFALGLFGEVTAAEINGLEDFYRSRRAPVNIEVCPLADASLVELLSTRGYRPIEFSNVLVRALPLEEEEASAWQHHEVRAREAMPDEEQLWAQTVAYGFVETADVSLLMRNMLLTAFHTAGTHCFVAEQNDTIIGGGSLSIRDRIAALAGASTLPDYRKRGAHGALLDYRLRFAARCGCELATIMTLPGSASQRNAERHGFQVAYTRTKWLREWA